jgi:hypothetical protein
MSLIQELGSQLRGAAGDLPVSELAATADRLRRAVERLASIRHESTRGIGVAPLGHAVEHIEHALRALMVAQEDVAAYLAAIGLAGEAAVVAQPLRGRRPEPVGAGDATPVEDEPAAAMSRWWPARVDKLTGYEPEPASDGSGSGGSGSGGSGSGGSAATDSTELLRRVAAHTGGGDRAELRTELRRVPAATGLGLAALAATALRRLAAEILGHPPGPADLPALRSAAGGRTRELLPNLDPKVGDVLLSRVCRVPVQPPAQPESRPARPEPARPEPARPPEAEPAHPADSAIAGAVLTGVLLRRAGRSPSTLDRYLVAQPLDDPSREPAHA